jgi:hypothetical protein
MPKGEFVDKVVEAVRMDVEIPTSSDKPGDRQ